MSSETLSYWNKTAEKSEYPRLKDSLDTDVLIIGGGITGVTCAYCLAKKGVHPVLIEAGNLCDGTTGNTTGKITIQHDVVYEPIFKKYGSGFAKLYAQSQTSALKFVKECVDKESIDCQMMENTAYVYTARESEEEKIRKEYEVATELGIETELLEHPDFPEKCICMLGYKHQYVFHSVRYVEALAKSAVKMGGRIFCDTKAYKLEDGDLKTVFCENDLVIRAKHVVMATQYPFYDGPNLFYTRLYASRTYGIAVDAKKEWPDGSFINIEDPSRSVRTHMEDGKRVLIVVGEGHATGRGDDNMDLHYDNLIEFAEKIAGIKQILAKWSAQDYKTPDHIPYIGRISDYSNIYVATGFGKWGLSNGTLAGNLISELITDGNCRYEELYSRTRSDLSTSAGKVISEVAGQVGELIKSKIESTGEIRNLQPGEGRVIRYQGQRAGIYRGYDDKVTILDITCTHMTTKLNFNAAEKTWDCPAHGGRFSTDGKLLEGPPKNPLKVLYRGSYSELVGAE